jgi:anti-anti-sigma regulatory factor
MAEAHTKSIALPAVVDLDALDVVRDQLIEAVDAGPVAVNAAGVERVASNALLLLISAAETARRNGFGFSISGSSDAMQSAIERLGLTPHFAAMMKG